ncbi:hypothetical protein ASF78_12605 [Cellulomonas sp. Leaf334]|nr:hypothetical protein ASF78_12605 [Cellulomonas sp. Leaf334]
MRRLARGDLGYTEAGVAVLGAALVFGAALGSGAASSVVTMSDGVTWLTDEQTGQLVQVNPGTGRAERRLTVAGPGAELEVSQQDGHLVVGDARTGTITSIDLSTLLTGGQRHSDEPMRVLVGGGQAYLVTPSTGVVRAVDPLTLRDLGAPYRVGAELVDVVVDRGGTVWAVTATGRLLSLTWVPDDRAFDTDETAVRGGGPGTRLLPHDQGVTVFAPDSGSVLQVGGGRDLSVAVPHLEGQVLPAAGSPTNLAPAGLPDRSTVVLLTGDEVREVGVGALGCDRPGRPAVFGGLVYVPCEGAGRVVVLRPDGSRARADVVVPGGRNPRLLVDDGRLVVHTEDGGRAVMVETDGTTRVIDTGRGNVAVQDPNDRSSASAGATGPSRGQRSGADRDPGGEGAVPAQGELPEETVPDPDLPLPDVTGAPGERATATAAATATAGPGEDGTPGPTPSAPTVGRPTDVTAERVTSLRATIHVQVSWSIGSPRPDRHVVRDFEGDVVAEVAGDATTALVTTVTCGVAQAFTVDAVTDDGGSASARSPEIEAASLACYVGPQQPTPPTDVAATAHPDGSVTVTWTDNGSVADSFLVGPVDGATTTVPGDARSVVLRALQPAVGVQFVVQAVRGTVTTTSQPSAPVTVPGPPGAIGGPVLAEVVARAGDLLTVHLNWDAARDNGSPITGHVVAWSVGGNADSTIAAGPDVTFDVLCSGPLCTDGGQFEVNVTPRNQLGDGPTASVWVTVPRPAPVLPRDGDPVVVGIEAETPGQYEPAVEMTAHLDPPAAWAANAGECMVVVERSTGGQTAGSIGCGASSHSLGLFSSGGSVTVTVSALDTAGRTIATAAPATALVPPRNQWVLCFRDTGICNAPAAAVDADVVVVPIPWSPQLPPGDERPLLVAGGVGLLLTAAALRLSRVRGSRNPSRPVEENHA